MIVDPAHRWPDAGQLLEEAQRVLAARGRDHGGIEAGFQRIAALWGAYLGTTITPTDVAMLMTLLKVARVRANAAHIDSYVDIAGYAACGAEIATRPDREK